jgi:hypothetical protein
MLNDGDLRELARRCRLRGSHLCAVAAAACATDSRLAHVLRRFCQGLREEDREIARGMLLLDDPDPGAATYPRAAEFYDLWYAGSGSGPAPEEIRATLGCRASMSAHFAKAQSDSVAAAAFAQLQDETHTTWREKLLRALGLSGCEEMNSHAKAWLNEAFREADLGPLWVKFGRPVHASDDARTIPIGDEQCETAVLALLASPPPPTAQLLVHLVRAVQRTWSGPRCLPDACVAKLAADVDRLGDRTNDLCILLQLCLEASLPDRGERRFGLTERLAALHEKCRDGRLKRHLRSAFDACGPR